MAPEDKGESALCPVCGEAGRVYRFNEYPVNTGVGGIPWILGQAVCQACLKVVIEAVKEGGLPSPHEGGLDG
jgi:hypothetical protein